MKKANLEDLHTFVVVADSGSMSSAARILQITVNGVSNRIKRLEDRVGTRLFHRTTRSLALTEEGRTLLEGSRRTIDDLDVLLNNLQPSREDMSGVVRFGMPSGALTESVFKVLGKILAQYPRLRIQVESLADPSEIVSGGLDFGITPWIPKDSRLIARKIGSIAWQLCASPGYVKSRGLPSQPKDLERHHCLRLLTNPEQTEWILTSQKQQQVAVRVGGQFESDDSRVLADAVYAGLGIGVRPAIELQNAVRQGRLTRILPTYTYQSFDITALFLPGRTKIKRVEAVLGGLIDAFAKL